MRMRNLLVETETFFSEINMGWDDVAFIAGDNFSISVENFREVAAAADYYAGFGAQEVATDIIIVFNDGSWLERAEYDGAEGWVHKTSFTKPAQERCIVSLTVHQTNAYTQYRERLIGWHTLADLNEV